MTLAVVHPSDSTECRVALVPKVLTSLAKTGLDVVIQSGAGLKAGIDDDAFREEGARIVSEEEAWASDIVTLVAPPQMKT